MAHEKYQATLAQSLKQFASLEEPNLSHTLFPKYPESCQRETAAGFGILVFLPHMEVEFTCECRMWNFFFSCSNWIVS